MANRIVSVHAGIYGMGIYAIMLPSSGFSVAHCKEPGCSFQTLEGRLLIGYEVFFFNVIISTFSYND